MICCQSSSVFHTDRLMTLRRFAGLAGERDDLAVLSGAMGMFRARVAHCLPCSSEQGRGGRHPHHHRRTEWFPTVALSLRAPVFQARAALV